LLVAIVTYEWPPAVRTIGRNRDITRGTRPVAYKHQGQSGEEEQESLVVWGDKEWQQEKRGLQREATQPGNYKLQSLTPFSAFTQPGNYKLQSLTPFSAFLFPLARSGDG
jgi:hypothetical protein